MIINKENWKNNKSSIIQQLDLYSKDKYQLIGVVNEYLEGYINSIKSIELIDSILKTQYGFFGIEYDNEKVIMYINAGCMDTNTFIVFNSELNWCCLSDIYDSLKA